MSEILYLNDQDICPVSGETFKEEKINFLTHLIGFILSLVGGAFILFVSFSTELLTLFSGCVYALSLVTVYAASAFYHQCKCHFRKRTLQIVDHICIYIFIAGSYTPFTLGPLKDFHGWELFIVVWSIAIFGTIFKIIVGDRYKVISLASYLLMGWLVVFNFPTLMDNLSLQNFMWLIVGGVAYTFGTLFYAWDNLPYNHAIWHLFVLAGSACHYYSILGVIHAF